MERMESRYVKQPYMWEEVEDIKIKENRHYGDLEWVRTEEREKILKSEPYLRSVHQNINPCF